MGRTWRFRDAKLLPRSCSQDGLGTQVDTTAKHRLLIPAVFSGFVRAGPVPACQETPPPPGCRLDLPAEQGGREPWKQTLLMAPLPLRLVPQEWVTSTELLISLDRLNTFGDDIFKDPKVLQSYYYAVSDFSVGGR